VRRSAPVRSTRTSASEPPTQAFFAPTARSAASRPTRACARASRWGAPVKASPARPSPAPGGSRAWARGHSSGARASAPRMVPVGAPRACDAVPTLPSSARRTWATARRSGVPRRSSAAVRDRPRAPALARAPWDFPNGPVGTAFA
jgi:hypothetical protein